MRRARPQARGFERSTAGGLSGDPIDVDNGMNLDAVRSDTDLPVNDIEEPNPGEIDHQPRWQARERGGRLPEAVGKFRARRPEVASEAAVARPRARGVGNFGDHRDARVIRVGEHQVEIVICLDLPALQNRAYRIAGCFDRRVTRRVVVTIVSRGDRLIGKVGHGIDRRRPVDRVDVGIIERLDVPALDAA